MLALRRWGAALLLVLCRWNTALLLVLCGVLRRVVLCVAWGWLRWVGWEGLAATDFPAPWGAVSWALAVFTSEFGMGSGVDPPPWPPDRLSQPRALCGHRVRGSGSGAGASASMAPCVRAVRGPRMGGGSVAVDRWMITAHGGPGLA